MRRTSTLSLVSIMVTGGLALKLDDDTLKSRVETALLIMAETEAAASTFDEAEADASIIQIANEPLWEQELRNVFDVMDGSGNDHVSKKEFERAFKDAEMAETFWDLYNDG